MAELAHAAEALRPEREPTVLADHRAECCIVARAWLECLDATFHRGAARAAPPAWISRRWPWGAPGRPLHWCEIPDAGTLGCGTSAALARELWSRRCDGIRAVQLVERLAPNLVACRHRDELLPDPPGDAVAYHEAIGRVQGGRLEIWDCTDCSWRRPAPAGSAGPLLGLKVQGAGEAVLRWGEHPLTPGSWTPLG